MKKQIKFLLCDLTGVIVHPALSNPAGYSINGKFFELIQLEPIFDTNEYQMYMLGSINNNEFLQGYISSNNLDLTVEEFDELLERDITPIEGMPELIRNISKTIKVIVVNNEGKELTEAKIKTSGVASFLTEIIPSCDVHLIKPDPKYFEKILEMIKAEPSECIFVDDSKKNVASALNLGIDSILFDNADQLTKELKKRIEEL